MTQFDKSRWVPWLVGAFGLVVFCIAAAVLVTEFRNISLEEISKQFSLIPLFYFLIAAFFTFLSYCLLVNVDFLALKYLGKEFSYRSIAPIAFSAFAVGHNVGVASLSGGAIRYRAYSAAGLTATQIATLIAFIPLTFGLGVTTLLALVLLVEPESALSSLPINESALSIVGIFLLSLVAVYLFVLAVRTKPIQIRGWSVELPSLRIGLLQVLLSSLDLIAASLVLFVLLRASIEISYFVILAAFVLALVVGVLSTEPGALGVFESIAARSTSGRASRRGTSLSLNLLSRATADRYCNNRYSRGY